MPDDPSVVNLVKRARDGDWGAWNEVVERYATLLWSICNGFGLSRADADDVAQTVWLKLVEQLGALRDYAALPGWLVTTTRRECLRVLREAGRHAHNERPFDPDIALPGDPVEVERALLEAERRAALRAAFTQLQPQCRALLSMFIEDPPVPYAQISERLGMPKGSIGPSRARCLAALRRCPALAALIDPDPGPHEGGK
jgi:RNA polymerase sigma factor (sigma-70 family)